MNCSGHEFPLFEVGGTSYEMGFQHGSQAAPLVQRYLTWIEKLTGMPRDVLCRNAMSFLPRIETLSASYVEEIKGLAEGAKITFGEAVLCQVRAEAAKAQDEACTAFALSGAATRDGHPLAGQNQDLETEYADVAILLRVRPTDGRPRAVMFTFAGQLGYAGMNEHGVAEFTNALYGFQWQPGLSHYPLKRVMLEQRTVRDCADVLRRNRTCSAQNIVMCDGQGNIADVECRPETVSEFRDDHPDWRIHANHYITQEFIRYEDNTLPDSRHRLERMRHLVCEHWGDITVETMKAVLADHEGDPSGICRHGSNSIHSISGYIAEPSMGLFHVRRGHGCLGTWNSYEV